MCVRVRMDGIVQLGVVWTCVMTQPSIDCSLDPRSIPSATTCACFNLEHVVSSECAYRCVYWAVCWSFRLTRGIIVYKATVSEPLGRWLLWV